jgi:hypothetical protein
MPIHEQGPWDVWGASTRKPRKWLIHCHIPHHTSNNNVEAQGAKQVWLYVAALLIGAGRQIAIWRPISTTASDGSRK